MADLYRVTITGADDGVDPEALLDLSAEFPFVEWAILRASSERPRYPSAAWLDRWYAAQQSRAPTWHPWAIHLCGEGARRAMAGCEVMAEALGQLSGELRVQLNGFSRYQLPMLHIAEVLHSIEFILQCGTLDALAHALELQGLPHHHNVSPLLDASGGRGLRTAFIPVGHVPHIGYAGGIGPENVTAAVAAYSRGPTGQRFWIDMESGVRTYDRFDLAKVRSVLEQCAPLIGGDHG